MRQAVRVQQRLSRKHAAVLERLFRKAEHAAGRAA